MKFFVLFAALFLTGCPGPGDRLSPSYPAEVEYTGAEVCMKANSSVGEYIYLIEILGTSKSDTLIKLVPDNPQPVWALSQQCLPTFDFKFKPGHRYHVVYSIYKDSTKFRRSIDTWLTIPE